MIPLGVLLLLVPTVATLAAVVVISVQIGASLRRPKTVDAAKRDPRVAVVVPAHDESRAITRTVETIVTQMPPGGRLLVVADNCTDNTADLAAAAGAEVVVRRDARRIGKGYALDHGTRALRSDPPDVVVFIDADCRVEANALGTLAERCAMTGHPVQARYAMLSPPSAGPIDRLSRFAWLVKNDMRPSGAANMGWPCQLMGTGMALPWDLVCRVDLANGHLAEDQKLGADLALVGRAPIFCREALVTSRFPVGRDGRRTQRTRWEHGHLAVMQAYIPPLIAAAVRTRSPALLAFALDLCVPPLSLLALLLASTELLNLLLLVTTGAGGLFWISSISIALLTGSLALAWRRGGRAVVSLRDLCMTPAYCFGRIPSLLRFFVRRQVEWIRTDRL